MLSKEQCINEFEETYETLAAAERRRVRKHINEILNKLCDYDKEGLERTRSK